MVYTHGQQKTLRIDYLGNFILVSYAQIVGQFGQLINNASQGCRTSVEVGHLSKILNIVLIIIKKSKQ